MTGPDPDPAFLVFPDPDPDINLKPVQVSNWQVLSVLLRTAARLFKQGCGSLFTLQSGSGPDFAFNADPDPTPHLCDSNLRTMFYTPC